MEMVENCCAEMTASMSERTYRPIPSATIQIDTTDANSAPATSRVLRDCHERLLTAGSPPGFLLSACAFHLWRIAGDQGITDGMEKG